MDDSKSLSAISRLDQFGRHKVALAKTVKIPNQATGREPIAAHPCLPCAHVAVSRSLRVFLDAEHFADETRTGRAGQVDEPKSIIVIEGIRDRDTELGRAR